MQARIGCQILCQFQQYFQALLDDKDHEMVLDIPLLKLTKQWKWRFLDPLVLGAVGVVISPQFDASLAISWGITKPIALIGNQEVQRRKEGSVEGFRSKRGCEEKEWSVFWMADENCFPCNLYFALLNVHGWWNRYLHVVSCFISFLRVFFGLVYSNSSPSAWSEWVTPVGIQHFSVATRRSDFRPAPYWSGTPVP